MGNNLVIVESPAKAKTIGKYLGKNFKVEASMGHIRDLPKSQMGVDIENNYEPKYITIRGKGDLLDKLKKASKKCDKIYLATDPDREGEAISWHLSKILKLDENDSCRIVFNEITKNAIKAAIKSPRKINMDVVDAQQARRVLDRLVGYEISPILWKKVKWGLSAGRVQSVALKIICDREKAIEEFVPEEYWTIEILANKEKDKKAKVTLHLTHKNNKKITINNEEEVKEILKEINEKDYIVKNIKRGEKVKNPAPPFITSTLQQDAYRKLNFSTKRTMSIAQQLYEGIDVPGHGTVALITYMRTDSVRISDEAQAMALSFIESQYGANYKPGTPRVYKGKKNIQDAHEAIRPTYVDIKPSELKGQIKDEQYKLYNLIWSRFMASQMASCILNTSSITVENGNYQFKASGNSIKFDGYQVVYNDAIEEEKEGSLLPDFEENEKLEAKKVEEKQHFTVPPARFSEATLVKVLEENGIGRPSTYAPIVSTLLGRSYVEREKKNLIPTELGKIVNNIMSEYFESIVDAEFTANMEDKLDNVEEGTEEWKKVVDEFFKPLKVYIDKAEHELAKITIEDKVTDIPCDKCGRMMVIKKGRFGDFLACPGYPDCKNTKPIVEEIDVPCPKCSSKILARKSKKGKKFFGCSSYPNCDFVSWFEPTSTNCDKCGTFTVKKYSKTKGNFLECSNKECKNKIFTDEK